MRAGEPGSGSTPGADATEALSRLCEIYWPPLYQFATRRLGDVNQAQDATQAFFTELLEKRVVAAADPQRGRFRAFLLTAFKNFLHRQWQRDQAQKRGGGRTPLSLDFSQADSGAALEPSGGLTAEQLFDQQWTFALLGRVLARLESEYADRDQSELFRLIQPRLVGDGETESYAESAAILDMSEPAVRQAVSRLRKRYGVLLREEIAETVDGPDEVELEIQSLFSTLRY